MLKTFLHFKRVNTTEAAINALDEFLKNSLNGYSNFLYIMDKHDVKNLEFHTKVEAFACDVQDDKNGYIVYISHKGFLRYHSASQTLSLHLF